MSNGKHKGRRTELYLTDEEYETLDLLRDAFATSTGRASISGVFRQVLATAAADVLDRRSETGTSIHEDQRTSTLNDRRISPSRRARDEARARVARMVIEAQLEARRRRTPPWGQR